MTTTTTLDLFQSLGWFCFAAFSGSLTVLVFAAAGFAIMTSWALAKHSSYKAQFRDYPKQRKAIVPFVI